MTNLKCTSYVDKEKQDNMIKYYQIKRNLIIWHNFTNFFEDYSRYNDEFFSVYLSFNGLSKNISHVVVV